MNLRKILKLAVLAPVLLVLGLGVVSNSVSIAQRTITVCPTGCDHASIQEAIDAAEPGDTIAVGVGTYRENLVIRKSLALKGSGPDQVTIDGSATEEIPATTIEIRASGVTVTGFTITNTRPEKQPIGIWIYSNDVHVVGNRILDVDVGVEVFTNAEIARNEILKCKVGIGVAYTNIPYTPPTITENTISECIVGIGLGWLPFEGLGGETSATIVRNTITKNRVGIFSYGAIANISLNVIEGNTGPGIGSSFGSSSLTITGNTIRRNGEEGIDIHGYDVAILLQNTVVENQGDGISLVVKFAQVAGNRILANGGNGISVWSPWFEDAIGVIVGTHEIPSYVHANEIRDNKGYGLFAKDASLILMCYGDKISGNGLGDFSENLKDKCKKAEEWE